ncbi:hypothetical protein ANCDUO_10541 [Ancylostoma duodenale]|uniref:Uncharacterized protein n=1 Tax=Ancylostoma duodenale TaxID=51022 RepID=A0A0C2CR16_9BILA|nr:hypothetical protein ANCDUO_10541 [Ancylostoma duodenale]
MRNPHLYHQPQLVGVVPGSAAFNLFCISAICVLAVASPNGKRIQMFKVFIVTAFFGTFAYIWLLVIWKGNKANLEDELEMADKAKPSENLDVNLRRYASQLSVQPDGTRIIGELPKPSIEFVRSLSRDVGRTYPSLSLEDQAKILAYRLDKCAPRDRLYYRIRAARLLSSASRKKNIEREVEDTLMKYSGVTTTDGRNSSVIFSFSLFQENLELNSLPEFTLSSQQTKE